MKNIKTFVMGVMAALIAMVGISAFVKYGCIHVDHHTTVTEWENSYTEYSEYEVWNYPSGRTEVKVIYNVICPYVGDLESF